MKKLPRNYLPFPCWTALGPALVRTLCGRMLDAIHDELRIPKGFGQDSLPIGCRFEKNKKAHDKANEEIK